MQLSFFAPLLKLDFDFFSGLAALNNRALDRLAEIPVRRKVAALLFVLGILAPLALLIVLQSGGERPASSALVLYCVGMILLLAPGSALLSHVLALRSIRSLNLQSQRLKMADFALEDLPPERGEEHDFLRLKRNLHWMGYALKSREDKLASAVSSLAEAQSQIGESIDYASLIQRAFLPGAAELGAVLGAASRHVDEAVGRLEVQAVGHFLVSRQLGSVGGDACWCKAVPGGFWVAVIDCTGHGVPGAFMTLIVHSMFERAFQTLNAAEEKSPGALLGRVHRLIKEALGQTGAASLADDGMDCSLCLADLQAGTLTFAGARGALYVVQRGQDGQTQTRVLKGEARGAGYVRTRMDQTFADACLALAPGMRCYMTTDGLLDQVGGERGLPFGRKRFLEFLAAEADQPLPQQGQALLPLLDAYRGREPQRDDITALGFELGRRNEP